MAETSKSFPNIPVTNWLSLRTQFKKTIPGTITPNYLASTLNMTVQSAKANIMPSLRQMGLIDQKDKTNQELAKQFRDDSLYSKFCKTLIDKIYPQEIRDAFPEKGANRDQVKNWFMNNSGIGDSAAKRIAAFYIALSDAELTPNKQATKKVQDIKTKPERNISQKVKPVRQTTSSTQTASSNDLSTPKEESKGPDLNINIQIHISSDASTDQIRSIFENMGKYIYHKE